MSFHRFLMLCMVAIVSRQPARSLVEFDASRKSSSTQQYYDNYLLFTDYRASDSIDFIRKNLDGVVEWLKANPQYDLWVFSYGGKRSCEREAELRLNDAKAYLIAKGLDSRRIKLINGGFRYEWFVETWVVIHGTPGPPAYPGINRSEATIIRSRRRKPDCRPRKLI